MVKKKPQCNNDFLTHFVDEAILLINTGLYYNEIKVKINFHGLICDAPIKAFISILMERSSHVRRTKKETIDCDALSFPQFVIDPSDFTSVKFYYKMNKNILLN